VKQLTIFLFLTFGSISLSAQKYITALGIRAGTDLGISLQQRLPATFTAEGIVQSNRYRWSITALAQYHKKVIGKRINFYLGGGLHWGDEQGYGSFWGITPIIGSEVTLARMVISWDYKPALNYEGGSSLIFHDSGVSVRYVLIKKKNKLFKNWFK
jgi:hypothetical protein